MIRSAMLLSLSTDLDHIGQSKARSYKSGGPLVAVVENDSVAIVQGYKVGNSISDCLPTYIKLRDLDGLAKACYGHLKDFE